MRNWVEQKTYCRGCGRWSTGAQHKDCPKGQKGSQTFLDTENFEMGCNKCGQIWKLEETTFTCSCGHQQKTHYTDSVVSIETGDQIIATDGDVVYVLKQSGIVEVGYYRVYEDISY